MKGFLIIDCNKNVVEISVDDFSKASRAFSPDERQDVLKNTKHFDKRTELYNYIREYLDREEH